MCPHNETRPDPVPSPSIALADIVNRFEDAWQQAPSPDLDAFLPAHGPLRHQVLLELVPIDLDYRLNAGQAARVEEYLKRYLDLAADQDAVLDLIVAEHQLRRRCEPDLDTAEYQRRFPQHREALRTRLPSTAEEPETIHTAPHLAAVVPDTGDLSPAPSPPARSDPLALPWSAHRYQLGEEIAHGGMGAVLRARDPYLGRELAVKVMQDASPDQPELLRRFVEEAQVGGQLQHPGIVPVYDVGRLADGRPFIAMKLIKGRTLAELLADRTDPTQDLPRFLGVFAQVCQTLAFAHSKRIIHRDLKPANIMVGAFGEVQVMDWGLAKVLRTQVNPELPAPTVPAASGIRTVRSQSDAAQSQAGAVMGTPAYMAPEQARGEVESLDERADVFGLGAILCEILTGQPPYTGRSANELQGRAMCADLTEAWRRLDACGADAELLGLARACLAAEKEARPRDAGVVAQAVTAYQEAVQARLRQAEVERAAQVARAEEAQATAAAAQARVRAERWARRLTLTLAAALLLTGTLGVATWRWLEAERQARATLRDGRVQTALHEALQRRGLAQGASGTDLSPWTEAVAAARQTQALLEPGVDPALRQQVEMLLAEVTALAKQAEAAVRAAEADRHLLDRLVDIRSARADDPYGTATDAAYAEAFAAPGLDVTKGPPAEAAARLRARPPGVVVALAASLDDWAAVRRERKNRVGAARLTAVAQAADSDPWRRDLRAAVTQRDSSKQRTALRRLAQEAHFDELSAVSLDLLGKALSDVGEKETAATVLRAAQERYPSDVWVNYDLARVLEEQGHREEALPYYLAARALRPETAHELAHALEATGERDRAIVVFQDLVRLRPKVGRHLLCLGRALQDRGRSQEAGRVLDAAVAALQEQIKAKPADAQAHTNLGLALDVKGQVDEAIACYRHALALDPKLVTAHDNLGIALKGKGEMEEAIACHRQALALDPKLVHAHNNLGIALAGKGQVDEAIACFRQALALDPKLAQPHYNLGVALRDKGQVDEAIACYRHALALDPKDAMTHNDLGLALNDKGQLDAALAAFRRALELNPECANAHCNLGLSLQQQGRYSEALASLKRGHELGSRNPRWRDPSAKWVQRAQRLAALEAKLPTVLKGESQPTDAERLGLAEVCQAKHLHRAAARFYTEAFAAQPRLADDLQAGHRYNAACVAALATGGAGAAKLGDKERADLRRQVLDWLRADLKAWAQATDQVLVQRTLQHWQKDTDLASVRDKEALAKLPPAERDAWQKLWTDVADLLTKSAGK
jgi:serine/threonine-protein kinase